MNESFCLFEEETAALRRLSLLFLSKISSPKAQILKKIAYFI